MQKKQREAFSIHKLADDLEILQRMSEFLIEVDIDLVSKLPLPKRHEAQQLQREFYDREVLPEINLLWKALQLSNFSVALMLIDSGLASIDHQMVRSGETCLIKALKVDTATSDDACINNEKDRDDIIKFLLSEPDECWAMPNVRDANAKSAYAWADVLAKKIGINYL